MKLDFSNKKIGDTVIHSEWIIEKDSDVNEMTITKIDDTYITCESENGIVLKFYKKTGVKIYRDYHPDEYELSLIRFYPDKETAIKHFKFKHFNKKSNGEKHEYLLLIDPIYKKAWEESIDRLLNS